MTPVKKSVEEQTITDEKKSFLDELIHISKAVGASILIVGLLGSLVWKLWAQELVDKQVASGITEHTKVTMPQVQRNSADIAELKKVQMQMKDTQMLTYLSLKQLLSEKQSEAAQREHEEIKRRQ